MKWLIVGLAVGAVAMLIYSHRKTIAGVVKNRKGLSSASDVASGGDVSLSGGTRASMPQGRQGRRAEDGRRHSEGPGR